MIAKTLSALVPTAITSAMLVSGATAEDSSAAWTAGTYAIGDLRHRVETHRIYKCAVAGSSTIAPELDPTRWVDKAPTNRWAMFDGYTSTATLQATSLTVVLRPGFFNALELRGVTGANGVTVTVRSSPAGPVIYTYTDDMEGSEPGDWWEYWYMPFAPKDTTLCSGIEPFINAEITITLTSLTTVGVGMLIVGDLVMLAATLSGAEAQYTDYSYIDIDKDTAENIIKKGPNARDLRLSGYLPVADAVFVDAQLRALLGVPCVIRASAKDNLQPLSTYGLPTGSLRYPDNTHALLNLDVKGLI